MKLKSISIYILFLTEKCCKVNTDSLTTLHLAPLIFHLTVEPPTRHLTPDTWHLTPDSSPCWRRSSRGGWWWSAGCDRRRWCRAGLGWRGAVGKTWNREIFVKKKEFVKIYMYYGFIILWYWCYYLLRRNDFANKSQGSENAAVWYAKDSL